MSESAPANFIRLRGVRHNNLKNFDLDLPVGKLIAVTGLSGSGKSSLAFDTLYAEGQRRYIETFSPYARQFFDRMDKPKVDRIEGIPPAIAIEQRNSVKTTRSTVGTMTEITDYVKTLWPHIAQLHCRQCAEPVRAEPPLIVWENLLTRIGKSAASSEPDLYIVFELPLSERLSLADSLHLTAKQGYQRLLIGTDVVRIDEALARFKQNPPTSLLILQDRLRCTKRNRSRFVEGCEQAYHFGKGKLVIFVGTPGQNPWRFSNALHCATCDLQYREPSPALFSFNHPIGACPPCRGFGRTIAIDYDLAIPNPSLTLAQGAVKPWQSGQSAECQLDLMKFCRLRRVPTDVPFCDLPEKWRQWVVQGDPGYGSDPEHEWPRAWYGVKGYFRWLESKAYKMHVRVLLSRYRTYTTCPSCEGRRFQPEALLFRAPWPDAPASSAPQRSLHLAEFYQLTIDHALLFAESTRRRFAAQPGHSPLAVVLKEICSRLKYLHEVGLGYLTLDRPTRSLSGGEVERVNLTTCLGSGLVNTLFVLDEPTVGLHHRDTVRLVQILHRLRDAGNTVVVVEHEPTVMQAADQIVDLGPGHGHSGGHVVFQGSFPELLNAPQSLTGEYLSRRRHIALPLRRLCSPPNHSPSALREDGSGKPEARPCLRLSRIFRHNLRDLTVEIPLKRLVCITGVSGSGKTTLVREVLLPALQARLSSPIPKTANEDSNDREDALPSAATCSLSGAESIGQAVLVDQSPVGRTPRSNPAVYIGAFDEIRTLFSLTRSARTRGLGPSAFSFNSAHGQCPRCRGAGFEKIEMQFLSDVYIRCPDCDGRRYGPAILDIKLSAAELNDISKEPSPEMRCWSIADLLQGTAEEAIDFISNLPPIPPAKRALASLRLLQQVGLGYLQLGQPVNTLSGGECQRLKLVRYLSGFTGDLLEFNPSCLFLFDEPSTGLHIHDVKILLEVFQALVQQGHSVVVVEHNLEVIKSADWLIDLGPEAGDAGGRVIAQGTPEDVAQSALSHTARALRETRALAE